MSTIATLDRRSFLKVGVAAGGGLILGFYLPGKRSRAAADDAGGSNDTDLSPNAFVRIATDGTVTVIANHSEMGQGVYTGLAMLLAEELDADWSKVRVESAPAAPAYFHAVYHIQMTGGSSSTWSEWERFRKAGATARALLIAAAASEWNVDPTECKTDKGCVVHFASDRSAPYGKLVEAASRLTPPSDAALKDPKNFKLIGKPTKRLDTPAKTNGSAVFGLDVQLPGMLVAVVARPPVFGGKVRSFKAEKAKAIRGVRSVIQIDRGIAVVADGFWPAKLGRDALEIDWDHGPLAKLDSKAQDAEYAELAKTSGAIARQDGDTATALAGADKKLEAVYELPYLAHATMEPLNCVADVRSDGCDVWTGTQYQTVDHAAAAEEAGLQPGQVNIHTTFLGGGFGRRAVPDSHFVREAVQLSKAVKAPVKVVWTREDDIHGGYYRPRAYHALTGGLDGYGRPTAWQHRVVCQSFVVGTPFEAFIVRHGVDRTAVEGAADLPYGIANVAVDWQMAPGGIPTIWWRSVGHSHTAFAVESFIDELAHAAGKDPFELRRELLGDHRRHKRALELAAEKSGWGKPLPKGHGRGIAVHESFGSFIAHVVEASVSKDGDPRVHRVTTAVDCGPTVNPDSIRAQMESAVVFGLTAALYGEITFKNGRVVQNNFNDYRMLRIDEMPEVDVHIVASDDRMGGIGEPGVPPIAPALTNAIFAATGKRVRRLPIRRQDLI